jgi:hypothetical protein
VAIPLADPLMSLVDNVCIARVSCSPSGTVAKLSVLKMTWHNKCLVNCTQFAGTLELAALAPCTLIFSMG